jgi:hypothetical protein
LVYRKGNFYLHISITIPAPEVEQPQGNLGVDLGFNRVAVTSDNKFHTAKNIRHKKSCYKRTRRSLQANGGKSPKRALELKNVPWRNSSKACRSCSCLFITIRRYQATGSSIGFPDTAPRPGFL